MDGERKGLLPTLISVGLVVSVISGLGAPLIPQIAQVDHVSLSTAQWSLTLALLSGAVAAPLLGRLGDGPRRRPVLLAGLVVVLAGNVAAAVGQGFALLLVGRGLQGIGIGFLPLVMAVARDNLPPARVGSAISILSVTTPVGAGLGYPITGVLAQQFDYRAAFWFGAAVTAVALVAAAVVVPDHTRAQKRPADLLGGLLLSAGLAGLLLALGDAQSWGWGSGLFLGVLVASLAVLGAWGVHELRVPQPLVDLRLASRRLVLLANLTSVLIGVTIYLILPVVMDFMQTPSSHGYGFGASTTVAGLALVPFSVANLAASRITRAAAGSTRPGGVLPFGTGLLAAALGLFLLAHSQLWEVFVVMALVGIGCGLTFAAMPGLILRAVPPEETGSAMGLYRVMQFVGTSLGSALSATVLAIYTRPGTSLPSLWGYKVTVLLGVAVCVTAGIVSLGLSGRMTTDSSPTTRPAPEGAGIALGEGRPAPS